MQRLPFLFAVAGLVVMLTGCPSTEMLGPTFTLRLDPPTLTLRVAETGEVSVHVVRSGGFTEPVTVALMGNPAGLEAAPVTITKAEGALKIRATDVAQIGTSFLTVNAEGGGVEREETLTLHIGKAVASPTGVVIEDNGDSRQVRQGYGAVTLVVTGSNLERATGIALAGLEFEIEDQTATSVELTVAVPHGTPPGAKDLVLSAAGGDTTFASALEVTAITAGPAGDDAQGAGTTDRPYRTLTHGLSLSEADDTVRLLQGVYSADSGEVWPRFAGDGLEPGPNVPVGVRVVGERTVSVVLDGLDATDNRVGLAFAGDGGAEDLTVTGFGLGLFVTSGEIGLQRVSASGNGVGVGALGGKVTAVESEFAANTGDGVQALGEAALELTGGTAHHNKGDGVGVGYGSTTLHAIGFESHHNTNGIAAAGQTSVVIENAKLHDNLENGLEVLEEATASIAGSDLYANGQAGIWQGGKSLKVRGSTLRDNSNFGAYIVGKPERIDFGTFIEPGNNELRGNGHVGAHDHLFDDRPARAAVESPIIFTASATHIGGVLPEPDVYVGPRFDRHGFTIVHANNVIQFY